MTRINALDIFEDLQALHLAFSPLTFENRCATKLSFTIICFFCSLHIASLMLCLISFTWPSIHYVPLCLDSCYSAQQCGYFESLHFAEANLGEEY